MSWSHANRVGDAGLNQSRRNESGVARIVRSRTHERDRLIWAEVTSSSREACDF
ncbi:hypothetical protein ACFPXP_03635 [Marinicrinis lubricantis]|uniref:Tn3 transposase DDE domain-containing protein n=1 Tax=Marinicrinis lubricantis TaxID=2086470 RepID=A0ABW1IL18_9BACL